MYESTYQLSRRPFAATPDPSCVVETATMVRARTGVLQSLAEGGGIAIVTAPSGHGKTLLAQWLVGHLGDEYRVAYVPSADFATKRGLLQSLLYELGRPYERLDERELRLALVDSLRTSEDGGRTVMVLDEAHHLNRTLLEELRLLILEHRPDTPTASLVLLGQHGLEETLAEPGLEEVNQRIRCHAVMESLDREESRAYVAGRVGWAGGAVEQCFDDEALRLIAQIADGNPRVLNQVCDQTLLLAHIDECTPASAQFVVDAYEALRPLPLPLRAPVRLGERLEQRREATLEEAEKPEPRSEIDDDVDSAEWHTGAAIEVGSEALSDGSLDETPASRESGIGDSVEPDTDSTVLEVGWTSPNDAANIAPPSSPEADPMPILQSQHIVSALSSFDDQVAWTEEVVRLTDRVAREPRPPAPPTPPPLEIDTRTEESERHDPAASSEANEPATDDSAARDLVPLLESALEAVAAASDPSASAPPHPEDFDDAPTPATECDPEPETVVWETEPSSETPDLESRIERELAEIVAETTRAIRGTAPNDGVDDGPTEVSAEEGVFEVGPIPFASDTPEPEVVELGEESEPHMGGNSSTIEYDVVEPELPTPPARTSEMAGESSRASHEVDRPYARLFSELRRELAAR